MYHCPHCDEWMGFEEHHRPCPALVARVEAFETAARLLVVDVCDADGPAYRGCTACTALDAPYGFRHDPGCPAKPILDLAFGTRDADHAIKIEG